MTETQLPSVEETALSVWENVRRGKITLFSAEPDALSIVFYRNGARNTANGHVHKGDATVAQWSAAVLARVDEMESAAAMAERRGNDHVRMPTLAAHNALSLAMVRAGHSILRDHNGYACAACGLRRVPVVGCATPFIPGCRR